MKFSVEKIIMPAADLNGESSLPALDNIPSKARKRIGNYDDSRGLFLGYGFVASSYPHRAHDRYTRDLKNKEIDVVILENDYLKAVFMPSMGGKLWSLYDKKAERDLLFANPVVRYCNLATRNAWTSGGVEFNIGECGHNAYTCDTLFTARTQLEDGTPVLRMYEFSRIRSVVYQMDFWLPETSRVLFCRMRIMNPNFEVRPMYWWSNAAVPAWEQGRILVPADEAYMEDYTTGMCVVPIPNHHDADMSYYKNNFCSDTFYNLSEGRRRFLCYTDKEGYTYAHTSTKRLKSRKLFVWGNGEGGKRWQEFLSGNGNPGSYIEVQSGIANTQAEHIPMPPMTAWEWVETYGALQLEPSIAHGDYHTAGLEAEKQLEAVIPAQRLEEILNETKKMATSPAKEILFTGSGWGALENERRAASGEALLPTYLDFGKPGEEQVQWQKLLTDGSMGEHQVNEVPPSWMRQPEWVEKMEEAVNGTDKDNWYTWLQLGCAYLSERSFRFAKEALEKSMELKANCWALYALACMEKTCGDKNKSAHMILEAASMNPTDISLACAAARYLHEAGMYAENIEFIEMLDASISANSRVRLYHTYALLRIGKVYEADALLYADGGINVVDIREAEVSITELWFDVEEAKAEMEGRSFDRAAAVPPKQFDFRMHAE